MGFELPLDLRGTPFQLAVWEALQAIPYGETRSYAEIARRVGQPKAVRAVGAANGANPVALDRSLPPRDRERRQARRLRRRPRAQGASCSRWSARARPRGSCSSGRSPPPRRLGQPRRFVKRRWRRAVADVVAHLGNALEADSVVLGVGNARLFETPPAWTRLGDNANAFRGGSLLAGAASAPASASRATGERVGSPGRRSARRPAPSSPSDARRRDPRRSRRGSTRGRADGRARRDRPGSSAVSPKTGPPARSSGRKSRRRRRSSSSATSPRCACTPEPVGSSTVKPSPRQACRRRSDSIARKFSGNQIGPRQFELPPKSPRRRLGGLVVEARLARRRAREDERVLAVVARERAQPVGREELVLVEHAREHAPQPRLVDERRSARAVRRSAKQPMKRGDSAAGARGTSCARARKSGSRSHEDASSSTAAKSGTSPTMERARSGTTEPSGRRAGGRSRSRPPRPRDCVHRGRDRREVLEELERNALVGPVVVGQTQRDLEHVEAEHRHPGRAVRLLEHLARRKHRRSDRRVRCCRARGSRPRRCCRRARPCGSPTR